MVKDGVVRKEKGRKNKKSPRPDIRIEDFAVFPLLHFVVLDAKPYKEEFTSCPYIFVLDSTIPSKL